MSLSSTKPKSAPSNNKLGVRHDLVDLHIAGNEAHERARPEDRAAIRALMDRGRSAWYDQRRAEFRECYAQIQEIRRAQ